MHPPSIRTRRKVELRERDRDRSQAALPYLVLVIPFLTLACFGITTSASRGEASTSAPALTQATTERIQMTQADRVHNTPPTNTPVRIASNQQRPVLRVGSFELHQSHNGARRPIIRPLAARIPSARVHDAEVRTSFDAPRRCLDKFIPETTILVDVHMGRLRRKVDGQTRPR
jgi:hypothetical protein